MAPSSWQKTMVGSGSGGWEVFVLVKQLCKRLARSILTIHPCFSCWLHFCSQVFLLMRYSVGILLSYQNKNTNYNTEWRVTPWTICKAQLFLATTPVRHRGNILENILTSASDFIQYLLFGKLRKKGVFCVFWLLFFVSFCTLSGTPKMSTITEGKHALFLHSKCWPCLTHRCKAWAASCIWMCLGPGLSFQVKQQFWKQHLEQTVMNDWMQDSQPVDWGMCPPGNISLYCSHLMFDLLHLLFSVSFQFYVAVCVKLSQWK